MIDPDGRGLVIFFLIVFVLVGLFLSLCEFAFGFVSASRIKKMAEEGNRKAQMVQKLNMPGSRLNVTLQTGTMLCWLFSAASLLWAAQDGLCAFFCGVFPLTLQAGRIITDVVLMLALAFVLLVLDRLLPKRIAAQSPEAIAMAVAPVIRFFRAFLSPLGYLIVGVSWLLAKLFGFTGRDPREGVTEEEIMLMVDAGQEKGVLEESQKEMISNIFDFEDLTAGDIMTHRTDILGIEANATLDEAVRTAIREGYSRIPVYENDIDSIIGILYSKDLLRLLSSGRQSREFHVRDYMRPALYVPESNRCSDLFKTFTSIKTQIAVVVDEYGGTSGIVTMEDLLEEIVGNIQDEYDNDDEEIIPLDESTYVVDAVTSLDDVADLLHISFEEAEGEECDTLGGFIIYKIGRIPSRGDRVVIDYEGYRFTVLSVRARRILKIRVEKLQEERDSSQENED